MSTFKVSIEKISNIYEHPNADRLALAKMEGLGFQFIVPKDRYSVGDEVVYFPVDSLLQEDTVEALGLKGKLSGRLQNRVKTIKLRGELSQGLAADPRSLGLSGAGFGEDVTERLGVTKWEMPEDFVRSVRPEHLGPLPDGVPKYDLEGCDRHPGILKELFGEPEVVVTEKLEGTNFAVSAFNEGQGDHIEVMQRRFKILKEGGGAEHAFWKYVESSRLDSKLLQAMCDKRCERITLRGEYVGPGVQKNIYGLTSNRVVFFDVLILKDNKIEYLSYDEFRYLMEELCLEAAPEVFKGPLSSFMGPEDFDTKATFKSSLPGSKGTLAEGIVIKPTEEREVFGFGRLVLKHRSREYLAKTGL